MCIVLWLIGALCLFVLLHGFWLHLLVGLFVCQHNIGFFKRLCCQNETSRQVSSGSGPKIWNSAGMLSFHAFGLGNFLVNWCYFGSLNKHD